MSTIFHADQLPFVYFATGLAWLAIALGMLHARWRGSHVSRWLIACLALEGGAGWMEAIVVRMTALGGGHALSPMPGAEGYNPFELARIVMLAGSCAAAVEYGLWRLARHRRLLPSRWVYSLLLAWLAIGAWALDRSWLAMGICSLRAWPGVVAAAVWLYYLPTHKYFTNRLALLAFHMTLLLAALASCLAPPVVHMFITLLATLPAWRILARRGVRRSHEEAPLSGALPHAGDVATRIGLWRRAAPPVSFGLALLVGWFALTTPPRTAPLAADEQEIAALVESLEPAHAVEPRSDRERQLERCGLALAPIAALVLAVWGLSRLPFAR